MRSAFRFSSVSGSYAGKKAVIDSCVPKARTIVELEKIAKGLAQRKGWEKTAAGLRKAVDDLRAANNPQAGMPDGPADAELAVDPYFPRTIPSVAANLKGLAVHFGGRNRLFLDGHVKWLRDVRTD